MVMRKLIVLVLILASCQEKKEVIESGVRVIGSDLFDKIATIEVVGGSNLGEIKLGSDIKNITVKVTNNSSDALSELALDIDFTSNAAMKFLSDGINPPQSPGFGGTCQTILLSKKTCTYVLSYSPTVQAQIEQKLTITYKTKKEEKIDTLSITALTGEEGKLEFTSGRSLYNNGLKERTDRSIINEQIEIQNVGFLPVRSMVVGMNNTGGSQAYKIVSNNCPSVLKNLETCIVNVQYQSLNHKFEKDSVIYNNDALDGDIDIDYHGELQFSYNGYYLDGTKTLVGFFDTRSVTIAANFTLSGNGEITFKNADDEIITAGNTLNTIIPITNSGFKEGIIKQLDIRDASQNIIANCYNEEGTHLNCYNTADLSLTTALNNNLVNNPFKIEDMNDCVAKKTDIEYTRLADKSLDIPSIKQVAGSNGSSAGESCFFRFIFHPSVNNLTTKDFSGYEVSIVYDSTWKNEIFIKGDDPTDLYIFRAVFAQFYLPARLEVDGSDFDDKVLKVNNDEYPIIGTDPYCNMNIETPSAPVNACDATSNPAPSLLADLDVDSLEETRYRCFDLGRVALISTNSFKRKSELTFKNIGGSSATSLVYKDGNDNPILGTANNLNTFYESLRHSCTPSLANNRDGGGGFCSIMYDLTPVDQSGESANNALMFDEISDDNTSPHFYKKFTVLYNDGATINDDGTAREKREIHFKIRAKLAGKGFLNFKTHTGGSKVLFAGSTIYDQVEIENVGTSPIKSIQIDNARDGTYSSGGINEVDIVPSAFTGTDKDCYHSIEGLGGTQDTDIILNPGESCFVMYKIQADENKRMAPDIWYSYFKSSFDNTTDLLVYNLPQSEIRTDLSFTYFDNDVGGRCASDTPDDPTYGDNVKIEGTNSSNLKNENYLGVTFENPSTLIPSSFAPAHSAFIYRKPFTYPDFGGSGSGSFNSRYWPKDRDTAAQLEQPEFFILDDQNFDLNTANVNGIGRISDDNQAYTFFGGTFPADDQSYSASISFSSDSPSALNPSFSYESGGDTEITALMAGQNLTFTFTPPSDLEDESNIDVDQRFFQRVINIEYEDRTYDLQALTDYEFNLMSSVIPKVVSYQIKVVFKAIRDGGDVRFKVTDYEITDSDGAPSGADSSFNPIANGTILNAMTFTSVKGSETIARKRITLENTGGVAINDLRFFDSDGMEYSEQTDPSLAAEGFYIFDKSCSLRRQSTGVSLDGNDSIPGGSDECFIDIGFKPLSVGGQKKGKFVIFYSLGTGEYVKKQVEYIMESTEPATIQGLSMIVSSVEVRDPGNPFKAGHNIDIGNVVMTGLEWTNTYTFTIQNTSAIRASLRASLDGATLDSLKDQVISGWTELRKDPSIIGTKPISTSKLKVEAHQDCFGTTDESTGFNDSANICSIRATIKITKDDLLPKVNDPTRITDFGYNFFTYDYNFTLDYFSYKRESISKSGSGLTFGFFGKFLPKVSTPITAEIVNVGAYSNGDLDFEWGSYNSVNDNDWGNIVKYRVYFDISQRANGRIYGTCNSSNCFETTGKIFSKSGLDIGKTYYIYIVPVRNYSGKLYVSDSTSMKFKVVIPPVNTFYIYEQDMLIDKFLENGDNTLTLPQAQSVCSAEGKSLMTSLIFDTYVLGDSNASVYNINDHYHWLNDSAQDIQTIVTNAGYSYTCSAESNDYLDDSFKYEKSCNSCGCDDLNKLYGGFFLSQDYTFYTYSANPQGSARCYTPNASTQY